jgi:hypothetical protein
LVRFSEELSGVSSEGSFRICKNVCKIAALRLTSKADIESSELEAAASFDFPWRQQDKKLTPIQEKLQKIEFFPSEAGEIILNYLKTGHLDTHFCEKL